MDDFRGQQVSYVIIVMVTSYVCIKAEQVCICPQAIISAPANGVAKRDPQGFCEDTKINKYYCKNQNCFSLHKLIGVSTVANYSCRLVP